MPRKTKDLTNQRFGRLVAIEKINITGDSKWLCQCDCGNTKEALAELLLNGNVKSCGCLPKRVARDLTGERFGRLVVLKRAETAGRKVDWLCQCDCGNTKVITGYNLTKGLTQSCGCIKKEDLTNRRFGKLVALERVNATGPSKWLCQCDCGNTTEVLASSLLRGTTKSCKCLQRSQIKDLTNQRFGRLIALERVNIKGPSKWLCQCDCGNTKIASATNLMNGDAKSCGCLRKPQSPDLTNQRFGKLVAIRKVNTTGYPKWLCQCDCGNMIEKEAMDLLSKRTIGCKECNISGGRDHRKQTMKEKYTVDGVYAPLLTSKLRITNTSGYKGVSYDKRNKRWAAQIRLKGKTYYLGAYKNKENAIKARQRAEEELFEPILEKYAKLREEE